MEQAVKERLLVNTGCPRCGSYFYSRIERGEEGDGGYHRCNVCGRDFGYKPPADINPKKGFAEPPVLADLGCKMATREIGRQSSCWECPFDDCVANRYDDVKIIKVDGKDIKIIQAYKSGSSKQEIAKTLHVGKERVRRVLSSLAAGTSCE